VRTTLLERSEKKISFQEKKDIDSPFLGKKFEENEEDALRRDSQEWTEERETWTFLKGKTEIPAGYRVPRREARANGRKGRESTGEGGGGRKGAFLLYLQE